MQTVGKAYAFKGLAGCVSQARSRQTGTVVGVYHAGQSGLECDPSIPWMTVCEDHGNLVGHPTLTLARSHASVPADWCEDCQDAEKANVNIMPKNEPSNDEKAAWDAWVAARPAKVQEVAKKFVPWKLYRLKTSGHRVVLQSFDEPKDSDKVTMRVAVLRKFNPHIFMERSVFGIAPEDLEETEFLPGELAEDEDGDKAN